MLCQQGNATAKPLSHSYSNTLHALDLSAPGASGDVPIVAAASGQVVRVVTGAKPGDESPGDGFGNHVVLQHAGGYFTAYAHLGEVFVQEGADVGVGARLGTMSNTGKAGNPHLHFSMHRSMGSLGLPESVPIHGLVTAEGDGPFALMTSLELTCAQAVVSRAGQLYASENAPHETVRFGAATPALRDRIRARTIERRAAIPSVDSKSVQERINAVGAEATREELKRDPSAVARYWAGVISERDLRDDDAALREYEALVADAPAEPVWLLPWVRLRLGGIAARRGNAEVARPLLWASLARTEQGNDFRSRALEGLAILPPPLAPEPAETPVPPCDRASGERGGVCVASGAGRKGIVVFLHGKFSGDADVSVRSRVAAEAARSGYAVLAAYGERGLCTWEKAPAEYVCFPQEAKDSDKARVLAERIDRSVRRFARDHRVFGPKLLVGYSNGAFMAAKMVAEGLAPSFDGAAVLFGGLNGALPRRASGVALPQRLVLGAATDDPHHATTMTAFAQGLTDAGHPFAWFSRDGGHALQAEDVRRALSLLEGSGGTAGARQRTASTARP